MIAGPQSPLCDWRWLADTAATHGDAFYLIDSGAMAAAVQTIRSAFTAALDSFDMVYCYKANPTPLLCHEALQLGMGAELVSQVEFDLAKQLGVPGGRIIVGGVGRGPQLIRSALAAGATVVVDGDRDAAMVARVASEGAADDRQASVLLRVRVPTPGAPQPRLGMTPDHAIEVGRRLAAASGVALVGVHAHVVDRSEQAMSAAVATLSAVATALFPDGPPVLDLGGFVPRYDRHRGSDQYAPYVGTIARRLAELGWQRTRVLLELGSAVTMHAVRLAARVIDVRVQPGRTVATLAASVLHSSPNTRRVNLPVRLIPSSRPDRAPTGGPVFLAGSTPIDGDWLALDLPWSVAPGDFVVFDAVGAYSVGFDTTFEPSLPVLIRTDDGWRTARRPPVFHERFAGFEFP